MTKLFTTTLLVLYTLTINAQQKKDTLKVLFVGNSFTYYYNLPQVVSAMSKYSKNVYIDSRHSLVGGSNLSNHLNQKKGTKTVEILNTKDFDYVVLNHHSLAAIDETGSFFETSRKMVDLIRSKNAEPVFMMTWGYMNDQKMLNTISKSYYDMGSRLGVDIVPCGLLFDRALRWRPDLNLYDDYKHPSNRGTYLNGLAFFKYFTGENSSGIPKRIKTADENGQNLYLLFLTQEDSDLLQNVVDSYDFNTRLK